MAHVNRGPDPLRSMYAQFASGPVMLLGLGLVVAPLLLGYELQTAIWVDVVAGLLLAGIGFIRLFNPLEFGALSWVGFAIGVCLVLMPIFLAFPGTSFAFWINVVAGIFTAVLCAMSAGEAFEIK